LKFKIGRYTAGLRLRSRQAVTARPDMGKAKPDLEP
jgi:hypothetical protein